MLQNSFSFQALVTLAGVERLVKPVLPGLARCDVERLAADFGEPVHDLGCDELPAVVRADHGRRSVFREELLEHPLDRACRDRARSVDGERKARELVDHRERLERSPVLVAS